jgi:RND family efflux transporter MFP subunit
MHPSYTSDKPGIAPDCGMELVPVYDDGSGKGVVGEAGVPGAVRIEADAQQRIGVRVEAVKKTSGTRSLRLLGRVAPDENRVYRVIAGIEGRIEDMPGPTTGSIVHKGDPIVSFFSPDSLTPQQGYLAALTVPDRITAGTARLPAQRESIRSANQRFQNTLRNLGMSDAQIEELARTKNPTEYISIVSPATGIVLARSVAAGQRVEKGAEMYRIADLSQVWILADVYENEAEFLKPGAVVKATLPGQPRSFRAVVSPVPAQFDGTTRTFKVRIVADNPAIVLRPDMFVDIDLPVNYPAAIAIPADAVVDSGLKQVVFVEKGEGLFHPRRVMTGWRHGSQVEILGGLEPGERIVVSGTFLIDSESRLKAAAAGVYGESSADPVCGMEVDQSRARAAGRSITYQGKIFYFCSDECKTDFQKTPARFAMKASKAVTGDQWPVASSSQSTTGAPTPHAGHDHAVPKTGSQLPAASDRLPTPGRSQPTPGSRQPTTGPMDPHAGHDQMTPGAASRMPVTGDRMPMPSPAQPTTGNRQPAHAGQEPPMPMSGPSAPMQMPVPSDQSPVPSGPQPTTDNRQPTTGSPLLQAGPEAPMQGMGAPTPMPASGGQSPAPSAPQPTTSKQQSETLPPGDQAPVIGSPQPTTGNQERGTVGEPTTIQRSPSRSPRTLPPSVRPRTPPLPEAPVPPSAGGGEPALK